MVHVFNNCPKLASAQWIPSNVLVRVTHSRLEETPFNAMGFPPQLPSLTRLCTVVETDNDLKSVAYMCPNLTHLALQNLKRTRPEMLFITPILESCHHIQTLKLWRFSLPDASTIHKLRLLTRLEDLSIFVTKLDDDGFRELARSAPHLEQLRCNGRNLTTDLLAYLGMHMPALKFLKITGAHNVLELREVLSEKDVFPNLETGIVRAGFM